MERLKELGSRITHSFSDDEMSALMAMMGEYGVADVNTADNKSRTGRDRLVQLLRNKIKEKKACVKTMSLTDKRCRALLDSGATHLMGPAEPSDLLRTISARLAGNHVVQGKISQHQEVVANERIIALGKFIRILGLDLRWSRSGIQLFDGEERIPVDMIKDLPYISRDVFHKLRMKVRLKNVRSSRSPLKSV